jgi:hypothetical protein
MSDSTDIHIAAEYVKYKKVIERFTKKKVRDRYHRLLVSTREFIQEMGYDDHVVCNEAILLIVVLEYFSDIMRLKDFHDIDRVNDIKILAYETSWLLRRKPLQIKRDKDTNDQEYAFCNEQFAFSQLTLWLKKNDIEKGTLILSQDDLNFFTQTLFYHLKYRDHDPQTLELMLISFMAGRKYQHLLSTTLTT